MRLNALSLLLIALAFSCRSAPTSAHPVLVEIQAPRILLPLLENGGKEYISEIRLTTDASVAAIPTIPYDSSVELKASAGGENVLIFTAGHGATGHSNLSAFGKIAVLRICDDLARSGWALKLEVWTSGDQHFTFTKDQLISRP